MVAISNKEASGSANNGMQNGRKRKKMKPILEPVSDSGEHGNSKFARALGSGDFLTREKGVQALTRFLQHKTDISESDMVKLWHGLYFCFWHSDTPPVQADLASRLAGVLSSLNKKVAQLYFTVFIKTMQREWQSIHYLRLDKFLMLVRKFLGQALTHLAQNGWEASHVSTYMQFLLDHVLIPPAQRSAGLTYHMCDVYVSEIKRTLLGLQQPALPAATLQALLQPFITALQKTDDQTLVKRIREGVFDSLLEEVQGDDDDEEEEEGAGGDKLPALLVHVTPHALADQLIEVGEGVVMRERNRAQLYSLSQAFEKAARKRAKREAAGAAKPARTPAQSQQRPTPAATPGGGTAPHSNGTAKGKTKAATPAAGKAVLQQQQPQEAAGAEAGPAAASSAKKRKSRNVTVLDGSQGDVLGSEHLEVGVSKVKPVKSALKASKAAAAAAADGGVQPHAGGASGKGVVGGSGGGGGGGVTPGAKKAAASLAAAAVQGKGSAKEPHVRWVDGEGQAAAAAAGSGGKQAGGDKSSAVTPRTATTGKRGGVTGGERGDGEAGPGTTKKSVKINLKKNLYFDFGGPVPDPMVRTPPTARSKGGILKKHTPPRTSLRLSRTKTAAAGSQSAPPKVVTLKVPKATSNTPQQPQIHTVGMQQAGKRQVTPNSVKRARAADLFS